MNLYNLYNFWSKVDFDKLTVFPPPFVVFAWTISAEEQSITHALGSGTCRYLQCLFAVS